jgi:RHS repeat-associated protein
MSTTILITFDGNDYAYTVTSGTLASGGNPGQCIDGGRSNIATDAGIRVYLPSPSTVTNVQFDWWNLQLAPRNSCVGATLYNSQGQTLWTSLLAAGSCTTQPQSAWRTKDSGPISIANVAFVDFYAGANWANGGNPGPEDLQNKIDNCQITFEPTIDHDDEDCPFSQTGADNAESGNPISLYSGEKREKAVDITVNTPAGLLTFERTYRQRKQGVLQLMGLGWTHNHNMQLIKVPNNVGALPPKIIIRTPNGSETHLKQVSAGSSQYKGTPGSVSQLVWNGTDRYTLTASDKSTAVFDATGKLLSRGWTNGESWTYSYYTSGAAAGKLAKVEDSNTIGGGLKRALVLRYYDSGPFAGHLYRVGDHTFNDTDPARPTGRYVEYSYSMKKVLSSGVVVDGTGADAVGLLVGVKDVRGKLWTYSYYGQHAGETDGTKLNLLTRRHTPAVDVSGDGTADGVMTLEEVDYTVSGSQVTTIVQNRGSGGQELAVNGDMESTTGWAGLNAPTTNGRVDNTAGIVDSGTYSRYVVAGAAGVGITGDPWAFLAGRTYIITARVYPVSGTVKMQVTGETVFTRTTRTNGAWNTLVAVYKPAAAASGKQLQFVADGGAATFYVDSVSITEVDAAPQLSTTFNFQPGGQNLTTEVTAGKTTTHRFEAGVYTGSEDAAGNSKSQRFDGQWRPDRQTDANGNQTAMVWSSDGKFLNQVTDAAGGVTEFSYSPTTDLLQYSIDAEGRKTEYTYGDAANPRLPTRIKTYAPNSTTQVIRLQEFTYDSRGRTLTEEVRDPANGTTVQQKTTRTYWALGEGNDDGVGLLKSVTQKDMASTNDVTTTTFYDSAGRVVRTNQNVTFGDCNSSLTEYDAAGNVTATVCNYDPGNTDPAKNKRTEYEYDAAGRQVKVTVYPDRPAYKAVTLMGYDALNRPVRTLANYVYNASVPQPLTAQHSAFDALHGVNNDRNAAADIAYNERGFVRRTVDVLGNVTLYGYDDAGRVVRVIANASQPNYNNSYGTGGDPTLSSYVLGSAVDKNLLTVSGYDKAGNLVRTTDPLGNVSYIVYDALNRPVKTVQNAKDSATIALNVGDTGYAAANDPRSPSYLPSGQADRDLIELVEYTASGQVARSRDVMGSWTLYGYDSQARQVRVIRNASTPNYNRTTDPSLASYPVSSAADVDILTDTAYDTHGRVLYTVDSAGERTWYAYDGLNRVVKTVVNAVGTVTDGSANDPRSASYVPSAAADRDLVTTTYYDSNARVQWTSDPLGRRTWYVYDSIGRVVKTIANCTFNPQNPTTPAPESPLYVGSADSDKDVISRTEFDDRGRVVKTFDDLGNETRYEYDELDRGTRVISNYVDGAFNASTPDEDLINTTVYDIAGRMIRSTDTAGNETRYEYDAAGRQTRMIFNYENGVFSSAQPDRDLISTYAYNRAGWVLSSTDARGTVTSFGYDALGRRRTTTGAAGTPLATTSYTVYAKDGRVLRTVENYIPVPDAGGNYPTPDEVDGGGDWKFNPQTHGLNADENLISVYTYDTARRTSAAVDPIGNQSSMSYEKRGVMRTQTDPEGVVTAYRYDRLSRRVMVVQNYSDVGEDPLLWVPDSTNGYWRRSNNTAIDHNTPVNDRNVTLRAAYDKGGRLLSMTDPRGHVTSYVYDLLDRRTSKTNPLNHQWTTVYSNVTGSKTTRETLTNPLGHGTQHDYDRVGQLKTIQYLSEPAPRATPDVAFKYDALGNRIEMRETYGATPVRTTNYLYDAAQRLTRVDFDKDGNGTTDHAVSYAYDAGGLRTQMTLPGNLSITYTYDAKGQLVGLGDWTGKNTRYTYDSAGRLTSAQRPGDLVSRYRYDEGGRLRSLRHSDNQRTFGAFTYEVDKRGNRTAATELVARAGTGATIIGADAPEVEYLRGTWNVDNVYRKTTNVSAALRVAFYGKNPTLTIGKGPDGSIFDVVINGALWRSIDGYASTVVDENIVIPTEDDGPHTLELHNRAEKNLQSTGYALRFRQLQVGVLYDLRTLTYSYDALSRLQMADYFPALNRTAAPTRRFAYGYDLAGNRISQTVTQYGASTTTNYVYNKANRLTSGGVVFDNAGRMTSDGSTALVWDRAGRLVKQGTATSIYNGLGQRIGRTVQSGASTQVYDFVLDVQPELETVVMPHINSLPTVFIHDPTGYAGTIGTGGERWQPIVDGLGTVRNTVYAGEENYPQHFSPYGETESLSGITYFAYTGEPTDRVTGNELNGLVYLRARHYDPVLGVFLSPDPVEGVMRRPMSRNGYSYVEGNPTNWTDHSGEFLNIIAGIAFGAIGGAIGGGFFAGMLYDMAYANQCGCPRKEWAERTDRAGFIYQSAVIGSVLGGIFGGIGASGIAPALNSVIGASSALLSIANFVSAPNDCTRLELLISLIGLRLSALKPPTGGTILQTQVLNNGSTLVMSGAQVSAAAGQSIGVGIGVGVIVNRTRDTESDQEDSAPSIRSRIREAGLPTTGRIRYVPPKNYNPSQPLPRGPRRGYIDRFGNEWVKGPSRTPGQPFEWDVQLSQAGKADLGWLSRDGAHVNVSLDGEVTH